MDFIRQRSFCGSSEIQFSVAKVAGMSSASEPRFQFSVGTLSTWSTTITSNGTSFVFTSFSPSCLSSAEKIVVPPAGSVAVSLQAGRCIS